MTPVSEPAGLIFTPPPIYQAWYAEVVACAAEVAKFDSSFAFEDSVPASVENIEWVVVPTEREDGRFVYRNNPYAGLTFAYLRPPRIVLSAPQHLSRRLVKHELLHVVIVRSTEREEPHGTPWGLCEFR